MTCRTYKADNLSLIYMLTRINHSCGEMTVNSHLTAVMSNHYIVAVTAAATA